MLVAVTLTVFSSCAAGNTVANDADGEWEGLQWSYKKESQTLTISGGGAVPSADGAADVPWKDVRSSVKKLKFSTTADVPFTSIGDYAFYGMNALTEVEIPEGVTSIGKCAFAFCSALDDITISNTVTEIGESAFEGCFSLISLDVPAGVSTLGERAFAFCKSLDLITFAGKISEVGKWTFKNCAELSAVRMDKTGVSFAEDAFEGAGIGEDAIKSLNTSVVVIVCKDAEGNEIKRDPNAKTLEIGEKFTVDAPTIKGYTLDGASSRDVEGAEGAIEVVFNYVKDAEEEATEAPTEAATDAPAAETPEEEKNSQLTTVIAVIIFVVVIVGIAVGGFLLLRSNKKTTKDSMTVRKDKDGKDGKNGKYDKSGKNKKK